MKRSKFGNVKTEVDGMIFASKKEAKRYSELRLLEKAGRIFGLRVQPKFPIALQGKKICSYVGDFQYFNEGDFAELYPIIEDVKGMKTPVYRLKKKLVEALYGIEIQEV